jgi:hypothetical protein
MVQVILPDKSIDLVNQNIIVVSSLHASTKVKLFKS